MSFTSTPEYDAGQAPSGRFTLVDGDWSARFFDVGARGQHFDVSMRGSTFFFVLLFASAPGQRLGIGAYEIVGSSSDPMQPTMLFSTQGRGCLMTRRRLMIHALTLGSVDTSGGMPIERMHATFEIYCQYTSPSLTGEISIVANPWR